MFRAPRMALETLAVPCESPRGKTATISCPELRLLHTAELQFCVLKAEDPKGSEGRAPKRSPLSAPTMLPILKSFREGRTEGRVTCAAVRKEPGRKRRPKILLCKAGRTSNNYILLVDISYMTQYVLYIAPKVLEGIKGHAGFMP